MHYEVNIAMSFSRVLFFHVRVYVCVFLMCVFGCIHVSGNMRVCCCVSFCQFCVCMCMCVCICVCVCVCVWLCVCNVLYAVMM